ncbi:MAG: phage tail tip lysozyme [Roseiarcus sp.]
MSAEVLKEFLVSLSFSTNEAQYRRFSDSIESVTKQTAKFAVGLEAAAVAAVGVVQRISAGFENLYYASSRVNSSAANINAFKYAISQLGGTAEGALSTLEAFSRKLREAPGNESLLRQWGVQTRDAQGRMRDSVDLMKDLAGSSKFNALPYFNRIHIAQALGIDEITYRALLGDVDRFTSEYRNKLKNAGLDPDKAAAQAKKFEQAWRSAFTSIEIIIDKVAARFGPEIADKFQEFTNWVDSHGDEIGDTLKEIGDALSDVVKWLWDIGKAVATFIHDDADPWIEKNLGITHGIEKLSVALMFLSATAIPALAAALTALMAGSALRGLVALLGVAGLGGIAAFVAGGALGMTPSSAGEGDDEMQRRKNLEGDPDYYKPGHPGGQGDIGAGGRLRKALGGGGGGSASASTRLQAMEAAMDQLRKEGVPEANVRAAAANLVGQADMESGLDPDKSHDHGTGYGIYGARNERRTRMLAWLARNGYAANDLKGQMRYMAHEAMTAYPATRNRLMNATPEGFNADSAVITHNFEGPLVDNDRSGAVRRAYGSVPMRAPMSAPSGVASGGLNDWLAAGGGYAHAAPAPAAPIGHNSVTSYDFGQNVINAKSNIVINGAGDPGATADAVARKQGSMYADALRNLQGAAR